jgi:hypothetical protein
MSEAGGCPDWACGRILSIVRNLQQPACRQIMLTLDALLINNLGYCGTELPLLATMSVKLGDTSGDRWLLAPERLDGQVVGKQR